jgi:hypothetical protein
MRRDSILLFLLAFGLAIFSISQVVQTIRHAGELGAMLYVQAILFGLLFFVSMFILAFGLYASEDDRGKVVKRVALFDRLLNKEKKK